MGHRCTRMKRGRPVVGSFFPGVGSVVRFGTFWSVLVRGGRGSREVGKGVKESRRRRGGLGKVYWLELRPHVPP